MFNLLIACSKIVLPDFAFDSFLRIWPIFIALEHYWIEDKTLQFHIKISIA